MTTQLSPLPIQHFVDNNGNTLIGGQLFTYAAGTSTPQATYTDSTGSTPNTNPVIMNARGEANVWLTPGQAYKFVLQDAVSTTLWVVDQITSPLSSGDLANITDPTKGSALIGYKPTWTGSVGRTVSNKLSDWVSVRDFGAKGDGATNDAAAFQAAIDYCNSIGGGTVLIPAGTYIIGTLLVMKRFVKIFGEGTDTAVVKPTITGNLFSIDLTSLTPFPGFPDASVGFSGFTIDCGTTTGVTGIAMIQCRYTYVRDMKFKGCVTNVYIDRGDDHSLRGLIAEGTATLKVGGFQFTSTDNADYCYEVHCTDIHFHNNYTTGTQANLIYARRNALGLFSHITLNDGWQGNTTAANGIVLENDCQGCKFTDVVMSAVNVGILCQPGAGPALGPSYCTFTNVDMDQSRLAGVILDKSSYVNLTDCRFSSSAVMPTITAGLVRNGSGSCVISNCQFDGYNSAGAGALDITGCSGIQVRDSIFSTLYNGITIGAATTSTGISGNVFQSVSNVPIAGTISQAGNYVKNNLGHKLTTNLGPAVPASTVATTNNTGYACTVYVSGGTFTVVAINGIFANLTGGYRLEVGDTIAITYSVVPSWTWIPSWG